jgi:Alpha-tubulin suppressor and related RCC1 domain-containing proteins
MNTAGQMGNGTFINKMVATPITAFKDKRVVSISAGFNHVLALTDDYKVYAWGYNLFGQAALSNATETNIPIEIEALRGKKVISLAGGFAHSLALTSDGKVYAWGDVFESKRTTEGFITSPAEINFFADKNVIAKKQAWSALLLLLRKVRFMRGEKEYMSRQQ